MSFCHPLRHCHKVCISARKTTNTKANSGEKLEKQKQKRRMTERKYCLLNNGYVKKTLDAIKETRLSETSEKGNDENAHRNYYKGLFDAKTINNRHSTQYLFKAVIDFTGPSIFVFPISVVMAFFRLFHPFNVISLFVRVLHVYTLTQYSKCAQHTVSRITIFPEYFHRSVRFS